MPHVGFGGLLIVVAIAFAAPVVLGLAPRVRLPAVVLEIVAGIIVGPSVLGLVRLDLPIQILSTIGLAFLLFLAGMEIDLTHLALPVVRLTGLAFICTIGLALATGYALFVPGLVRSPLLIAIILMATSLGLIVPVLKDAGEESTRFGQLVIAAASIADFGAVILLSLFFSRQASSPITSLVLLGGFLIVASFVVLGASRLQRVMRVTALFTRLQDTTAEIRVRASIFLLLGFVALAQTTGLETILAAFLAGAAVRLIDRDQTRTHPNFHLKLEAIGYGFLIPVFFIGSGVQFELHALVSSASGLLRVPLFVIALLVVRGLPAVLYRPSMGTTRAIAAALLQATSLPFIVAASAIGLDLGLLTPATGAALVGAGLVSVVAFPLLALGLLRNSKSAPDRVQRIQSAKIARGGDP